MWPGPSHRYTQKCTEIYPTVNQSVSVGVRLWQRSKQGDKLWTEFWTGGITNTQRAIRWRNVIKLNNKIALITDASKGIGKGIAIRYSQEGASVVLASRSMDLLSAPLCKEETMMSLQVRPKAKPYTRYPLASILIYNGSTVAHFLQGGIGIIIEYGFSPRALHYQPLFYQCRYCQGSLSPAGLWPSGHGSPD